MTIFFGVRGSEEAHFDSNQLQEQFLCKMRLFTPPYLPTAIVILNEAKRSEGSFKAVYQLDTQFVISNGTQ